MSRRLFLLLAITTLGALLLLAAGTAAGVEKSAYTLAPMSISPDATACLGAVETFSGGGATPLTSFRIFMEKTDGEFPSATVGTGTSDKNGNWTTTARIPTVGTAGTGEQTPMVPGTYLIQMIQNDIPLAQATFEATDCKNLPATGAEIGWLAMAGVAVLLIAGTTFMLGLRQAI